MDLHRRKFNSFGMFAGLVGIRPALAADLPDLTTTEANKAFQLLLDRGSEEALQMLGARDGFWGNEKVRITLPDSTEQFTQLLKILGLRRRLEEISLQINRAAEAAVPKAKSLLSPWIQRMFVQDIKPVLLGGERALTLYFDSKTRPAMMTEFTPHIGQSLEKLGVVEQINEVASKLSLTPMREKNIAKLEAHISDKTLGGLYFMIGEVEMRVRQNPAMAGHALLSKVFGAVR